MLVIGRKIKSKVEDYFCIQMEINMKGIDKLGWGMGKEDMNTKMAKSILELGQKISKLELVNFVIQMGIFMMENGLTIFELDRVVIFMQMVQVSSL